MASNKSLLITSVKDSHYYRHGFGVLVNKAIALAEEHYHWHGNFNVCIQDEQINAIFPNIPTRPTGEFYEVDLTYSDKIGSQAHQEFNPERLQEQEFVFRNVFGLMAIPVSDLVSVHHRGTDKKTEVEPVNYDKLKAFVQQSINDGMRIHFATDDNRIIEKVLADFNEKHFYFSDCTRSKTDRPIHFNKKERQRLNKEVWEDILMIAKSERFGYCYSNVSYLAAILGTNNHKQLVNLQ